MKELTEHEALFCPVLRSNQQPARGSRPGGVFGSIPNEAGSS